MKASIKRLTILGILKKRAEKVADRIDDDFLDQLDRQSALLALVAIVAALVVVILPAIFTIAFSK
jgi:hypothetical protein